MRLLEQACRAWDRWEEARKRVEKDGLMIDSGRYGLKQHPLLVGERDARLHFARLMRQLGLDESAPLPPVGARRRYWRVGVNRSCLTMT
jgi:P27 family predicted phage terminase small subunit